MILPLVVAKSKIRGAGDGCFALTFLPAGTELGEYKGKFLNAKARALVEDHRYIWKISPNRFVDAREVIDNNPLRFVNGAKTAAQRKKINTEAVFRGKKVFYRLLHDVFAGDELIMSYGPTYGW